MALFNFHFDRPGPGVSPDAPRKKGPARFFEILGRDLMSFYLAGLLALVSALPFVFGVWFAVDTHSLVPLLLAGVLGGMIAAPQLCGLLDTILRSLRDEPGFWWATYRRAWKRNARASLLPGAICGLLLAMQIFTVFHYDVSAGVVPGALLAVGLFLLLGLGEFLFAQVVLLDLPFAGLVKNSLFLFLGYLPRAGRSVAVCLLEHHPAAVAHQRLCHGSHGPVAARCPDHAGHLPRPEQSLRLGTPDQSHPRCGAGFFF